MLSLILLHDKSNPAALSDLYERGWIQRIVAGGDHTVNLDSALLDQATRLSVRFGQPAFHHRLYQADWESCCKFINTVGCLVLAELKVEVLFRATRGLFAVQALHQLVREGCFRVARLHRKHVGLLPFVETRDQSH